MCSLGREHFMPLTPPTCDHAIYLSIICINIPGVLSKRKHDFDTKQSLFFSAISRFSIAYKLVLNLKRQICSFETALHAMWFPA